MMDIESLCPLRYNQGEVKMMAVFALAEKLNIPPKTLAALREIAVPAEQEQLKALFFGEPARFRDYAAGQDGLLILRLYLQWLEETKARYDAAGISEQLFWDSMKDLAIWCEDYLEKHGAPGFAEWEWVGASLRLEVIRIGRLQFAAGRLHREVTVEGQYYPVGTPVLEVHIPAGEALDEEAVAESLRRAPALFKQYFGKEFSLFHCHSWLLSPALGSLLPPGARILRFAQQFTVYGEDYEERQAEARVFGLLSDRYEDYPEKTSLQRALKKALLEGETVGMGLGIRKI